MGNLRGWEWLILLAIVLLLFGARRLPDLARSVGRSLKIFRSEVKDIRSDEPTAPPAEPGTPTGPGAEAGGTTPTSPASPSAAATTPAEPVRPATTSDDDRERPGR